MMSDSFIKIRVRSPGKSTEEFSVSPTSDLWQFQSEVAKRYKIDISVCKLQIIFAGKLLRDLDKPMSSFFDPAPSTKEVYTFHLLVNKYEQPATTNGNGFSTRNEMESTRSQYSQQEQVPIRKESMQESVEEESKKSKNEERGGSNNTAEETNDGSSTRTSQSRNSEFSELMDLLSTQSSLLRDIYNGSNRPQSRSQEQKPEQKRVRGEEEQQEEVSLRNDAMRPEEEREREQEQEEARPDVAQNNNDGERQREIDGERRRGRGRGRRRGRRRRRRGDGFIQRWWGPISLYFKLGLLTLFVTNSDSVYQWFIRTTSIYFVFMIVKYVMEILKKRRENWKKKLEEERIRILKMMEARDAEEQQRQQEEQNGENPDMEVPKKRRKKKKKKAPKGKRKVVEEDHDEFEIHTPTQPQDMFVEGEDGIDLEADAEDEEGGEMESEEGEGEDDEEEGEVEIVEEKVIIRERRGLVRKIFDVVYLFFQSMLPNYNIYAD